MYNLVKIYYNYYGNLNVSQKFKTTNGYEYDENGEELGKWFKKQKDEIAAYVYTKYKIEKFYRKPLVDKFFLTEWQFDRLWKIGVNHEAIKDDEVQKKYFISRITSELGISDANTELLYKKLPKSWIDHRILWLLEYNIPFE